MRTEEIKTNKMRTLANITEKEIVTIFDLNGLYISKVNEKGDPNDGMMFTMNKWDSVNYFRSTNCAYKYFVEMNWIK
tara:strand:- start:160 stop:390 length:231 start_codon:yes stop_codon:yes gene_type:complete